MKSDQQSFSTGMSDTSGNDKSLAAIPAYNQQRFAAWMTAKLGADPILAAFISKETFEAIAAKRKTVCAITPKRHFTFDLPDDLLITDTFLENGSIRKAYFKGFQIPTNSPRTTDEEDRVKDSQEDTTEDLRTPRGWQRLKKQEQKITGSWCTFHSNAGEQLKERKQLLRTQSAPDLLQPFSSIGLRKGLSGF